MLRIGNSVTNTISPGLLYFSSMTFFGMYKKENAHSAIERKYSEKIKKTFIVV